MRRTLDQLYWDSRCTSDCGCRSLKEALERHPELRKDRDGDDASDEPPQENAPDLEA
jgi:hypothetical protein